MREIRVKKNDANQRLDKFLHKLMPSIPNALLYKYLRKKCVKINGKHCLDGAFTLSNGDILNLYISDEFFINDDKKIKTSSHNGGIDVVYEDENIILVNKPAGVSVHPDEKQTADTLIDRIISYLISKNEYSPDDEQSFIPALCNRLDRNTCGIVIAAKNAEALREMNEIIKNREIEKKYLCLVHGAPPKNADTLKHFLLKNSADNEVKVYDKPIPGGKTAILDYRKIKSISLSDNSTATVLEILLHTGRTHQIRAQLSYIGCSIVGDGKYGKCYAKDKSNGYPYQALCAYSLEYKLTNKYSCLGYLDGKKITIRHSFEVKR